MPARTIYFDTNLYSMMADRGDAADVGRWLAEQQLQLRASHQTLFEVLAISDPDRRATELAIMKALARPIENQPLAYRQAAEVRQAIRRRYPEWLRQSPNLVSIKRFLRAHKANWHRALQPGALPDHARQSYRDVSLVGIKGAQAAQKHWRKAAREAEPTLATIDGERWRLDSLERGWRADCAMSWSAALYDRREESRDYADYLLPYLRAPLPPSADFARLWMEDMPASEMPLNRLTGLAGYIQLERKPGQGNAGDVLHAAFLCDVDLFVTGDRDFVFVLDKLAALTPGAAPIFFVDRGNASTVAAIEQLLVTK